ncbi:small acidic protein-like [Branchiostoma lanceolatum]|uniref:small acidic protein-like n=1 Tax=Branchiostoma lanceolatum TaxID=7740 RepID=UPI0034531E73
MSSETPNDDRRGEKRQAAPSESVDIHSANRWESADLGDDQRKQKFLRLMGASKRKEHHGKIHIGQSQKLPVHSRSGEEEQHVQQDLEHQFQQGLESKLTGKARRHVGLGYQEPEPEDHGEGQRSQPTGGENPTSSQDDSNPKAEKKEEQKAIDLSTKAPDSTKEKEKTEKDRSKES